MEATASSTTSKKKTLKGTFYDPAGGFFSQKKKVVLDNIKHFGDEKDIFLSKSGSGNSVYSDVESLSDENKNVNMSGTNGGSLLGSAVTTLKTNFGFLLSFLNFHMDNDKVVLSSHLLIFLEKKWINSKIIKTPVEVSVKRSFALDINLSAVEKKSMTVKTQLIRKIFSTVNGFGKATIPSKFEEII
ncbi:hypothetical protein G9A89_010269 [Geosiphon pyriformis]|nr:hypothetical protein G9A89_010269 [Geosiphon pyriformis]